MSIKVPASAFDIFIKKIETIRCTISSKNIRSEDITEDYIDLETRLKNKRLLEQRYLELLKKAAKVEEMIDIEEKTEGVRTEIETMEGKIKLYNNEIAYSVVSMDISSQKEVKKVFTHAPLNFLEGLRESLYEGWMLVISFALFFLRLWAVWIITFVVILYVRRWRRNREKVSN
jgi:hypothetical protein